MNAAGSGGQGADRAPRMFGADAWTGAAIALLTLLSFFQFPGHTWLQSDTQIYLPIIEHIRDSSVFARDMLAQHPHVSFTIYDEVAIALTRLTGLSFHTVLAAQQIFFRALGIAGVVLIATALGFSRRMALLVAAVFSLGATIGGPAVLTFEYEPVPRGYAIPLLFLAIGLVAQGRHVAAGIASAVAFLYHPPTVLVFWAVYFCLALWPSAPALMRRRIWGLAPMLAGVAVLFVLSRLQAGAAETQAFFTRLGPELERLQRLRASYNWVGMWPPSWIVNYVFLWAVAAAAFWRIGKRASTDLSFFLVGLPLAGLLSMPLQYLLLDELKWSLIAQIQPARALLFVTAFAVILAAAAGIDAARRRRYWEAALWFLPVFAVPANGRALALITDLATPLARRRLLLVLALALLAAAAGWADAVRPRWSAAPWAAAALVPFFVIPGYGDMQNYPALDTPELRQLADWARASTPKDAVFAFPDAGYGLQPGIFREEALRAVYVDWKAGGQVNFVRGFGPEWWSRWQATGAGKFRPALIRKFAALGIDYVVLKRPHRLPDRRPVFENTQFVVYAERGQTHFPELGKCVCPLFAHELPFNILSTSSRVGIEACAPARITEIAAAADANSSAFSTGISSASATASPALNTSPAAVESMTSTANARTCVRSRPSS